MGKKEFKRSKMNIDLSARNPKAIQACQGDNRNLANSFFNKGSLGADGLRTDTSTPRIIGSLNDFY